METTTFLLVRHAESTWNAALRWQGHGDPPLSPRGREQAAALARSLAGESIDLLVSSDLRRAVETAEAVAQARAMELVATPALRELDVGRWTGLTRGEIESADRDALLAFEREDPDLRAGGGESRREIRRRARRAARELAEAHPGRRILVVTHLGVIRALLPGSEPRHAELLRASWRRIRAAAAAAPA